MKGFFISILLLGLSFIGGAIIGTVIDDSRTKDIIPATYVESEYITQDQNISFTVDRINEQSSKTTPDKVVKQEDASTSNKESIEDMEEVKKTKPKPEEIKTDLYFTYKDSQFYLGMMTEDGKKEGPGLFFEYISNHDHIIHPILSKNDKSEPYDNNTPFILYDGLYINKNALPESWAYVTEEDKSTLTGTYRNEFKLSLDLTKYIYIGKLKDNRPYKTGYIYKKISDDLYVLIYSGEFKEGMYHKSGVLRNDFGFLKYHGNFDEGFFTKDGVYYHDTFSLESNLRNYSSYLNDRPESIINKGYINFQDFNMIRYVGEFKKSNFHGNGKEYRTNGSLIYEGEFNSTITGNLIGTLTGKSYFENGQLEYDGEWKEGRFHGKGSLYDESGKLKLKGEFEDGKPK